MSLQHQNQTTVPPYRLTHLAASKALMLQTFQMHMEINIQRHKLFAYLSLDLLQRTGQSISGDRKRRFT